MGDKEQSQGDSMNQAAATNESGALAHDEEKACSNLAHASAVEEDPELVRSNFTAFLLSY